MQDGLACFYCGKRYPCGTVRCRRCKKPLPRLVHGRFFLRETLAVNTETVTYRALDESEHVPTLIRVLRGLSGQAARIRLEAEVRVQRSLAGTGLCPDFITAGEMHEFKTFFTAATFIDGVTLHDTARRSTPAQLMDLFLQVLDAVERVQREGIVVCNLDTGHTRVTPDGEVRIVDLRCARAPGARSHGLGKNGFKAPEQYQKNAPVSKSVF